MPHVIVPPSASVWLPISTRNIYRPYSIDPSTMTFGTSFWQVRSARFSLRAPSMLDNYDAAD